MALIGYARVSTEDQRLDLQRDALIKAGVDPTDIYEDKASGGNAARPGLRHALNRCGPGDTLVIWRLDRLARSLKNLIHIGERLKDEGVQLLSLTESLDTSTAVGTVIYYMIGLMAEFERLLGKERTKAGVAAARARGGKHGRPRIDAKKIELATRLMTVGGLSMRKTAAKIDVPVSTLQTYFRGGREALVKAWEASKRKGRKAKKKGGRR